MRAFERASIKTSDFGDFDEIFGAEGQEIWEQSQHVAVEPHHKDITEDSLHEIELRATDFFASGRVGSLGSVQETTGFEEYEKAAADAIRARERESALYLQKLGKRLKFERKRRLRKQGGKSFAKSIRKAADAEFADVVARAGVEEPNDFPNDAHEHSRNGESDTFSLLGASERSDSKSAEATTNINLNRSWICCAWCHIC